MFWVISVYFNVRNILPKCGTFPPGHPVYATHCNFLIPLKDISYTRTHPVAPQNSPDAAVRTLYSTQLRRERNKVHALDQLFQQLQGDNRVGMASEHPLKYFMTTRLSADEACQVTLSPVAGTKHLKAWAVPRDSPYTDILNYWYG